MYYYVSLIVLIYLFYLIFREIFLFTTIRFAEKLRRNHHASKDKNELKNSTNNQMNDDKNIVHFFLRIYEGLYRYYVFRVANYPSKTLRKFIYKYSFLMNIGKNVIIHRGLEIRGGSRINIGDGSIIGDDVLLDGRGGLVIGSNVNFSSKAQVYTRQHDINDKNFGVKEATVVIENRCWVSSNTIVLPGVRIGEGAVLAAGAVAAKDIDPFTVNAGIPSKVIGQRNSNLCYTFSGNSPWFL